MRTRCKPSLQSCRWCHKPYLRLANRQQGHHSCSERWQYQCRLRRNRLRRQRIRTGKPAVANPERMPQHDPLGCERAREILGGIRQRPVIFRLARAIWRAAKSYVEPSPGVLLTGPMTWE